VSVIEVAVGDFTVDLQFNEFHRITQEELNYLISDLDLPQIKAEMLDSRLQQWDLLKENVRISVYRKTHEDLVQFFKMDRGLVACTGTDGLIQTILITILWTGDTYGLVKLSLKAVLLLNGNTLTSIPVGHSVHNK